MDANKLRQEYNQNCALKLLCDRMASRKRNQNETKLLRLLAQIQNDDDSSLKKHELIAAFRVLEDVECGKYIAGRHGWPSRFLWSVKSLDACLAAQGEETDVAPVEELADTEDDGGDTDLIDHAFNLREDFPVELSLPIDLTTNEAERLALFMKSLPLEDIT